VLIGFVVNVTDGSWQQTAIAIGTCVAAFGFIVAAVGLIFTWAGVKENSKGRHAQLAVDFGRRWDSDGLATVRVKVFYWTPEHVRQYYEAKDESYDSEIAQVDTLPSFFEDLGVLVKLGILSLEWVDETLGSSVIGFWTKWHLVAADGRTDPANRKLYLNWETLARRLYERRDGPS
jgi:hypothetical protein